MDSLEFIVAVVFNFLSALIIVRFIYYPVKQSRHMFLLF